MSDSKPPSRSLKVEIPRKWLIALAVLLLGGGGLAGDLGDLTDLIGNKKAEKIEHEHEQERKKTDDRFVKIDMKLGEHTKQISDLDEKTEQIQTVQHEDIARQEARRATAKIRNRAERERRYDVLFSKNLKRLKKGKSPCGDAHCGE